MCATFLIDVDCSKVLDSGDEYHYTMFIDSSKMSIVYELVEWIRWMFCLENCFHITHNNSIIHELEDIEVLSKLKFFELKPCGKNNCIHNTLYRSLLKNLNLFVTWNGTEVHKYFLNKINKVDEKLSKDSSMLNTAVCTSDTSASQSCMDYQNIKFDYSKNFNDQSKQLFSNDNNLLKSSAMSTPPVKRKTLISKVSKEWDENYESSTEINSCFEKKITSHGNLSSSEDKINYSRDLGFPEPENLTLKTKKCSMSNINLTTPENNILSVSQKSSKKKFVKPFSLGEVLSSLREDSRKQQNSLKLQTKSEQNSPSNSAVLKENVFDKMTVEENLFEPETLINEPKKRHRTRKRKRKSRLQNQSDFIPDFLSKISDTHKSNLDVIRSSPKPNHIRFDTDDEDNFMDAEYAEDELKTGKQTKCENVGKKLHDFSTFIQNEPEKLKTVLKDNKQDMTETGINNFELNNTENKMDCSVTSHFRAQENLMDSDNQAYGSSTQLNGVYENIESKPLNSELNMLLSLKEKFKNAVVIERFY